MASGEKERKKDKKGRSLSCRVEPKIAEFVDSMCSKTGGSRSAVYRGALQFFMESIGQEASVEILRKYQK